MRVEGGFVTQVDAYVTALTLTSNHQLLSVCRWYLSNQGWQGSLAVSALMSRKYGHDDNPFTPLMEM